MNKTIGIIGGGQLALMLIQAASKYGAKCICLDPNKDAIAFRYATKSIASNYDDLEGLKILEQESDVILYEFENIDLDVLEQINQNKLYAGIDILKYSKNRILEKELAQKSGFKTTRYAQVYDVETLHEALDKLGYDGFLKTTELGYDGKGQVCIKSKDDLKRAYELLTLPCIYEERISFEREISLISVLDKNGNFRVFDPFENEHVNGILHKTIITNIDDQIEKLINTMEIFMKENKFYGILCIEFFQTKDQIYFNEMAPRPHNSGHITLDATNVSQFDQVVRAALGYKLLEPKTITSMSMINILGQNISQANQILHSSTLAKVYLYGKDDAILNRKMGHINIINSQEMLNIDKELKDEK